MQEKVIETKQCTHCGLSFNITDKDLDFYAKASPIFPLAGTSDPKKYIIPSPTFCPDCRQQRRLSFYNQKTLYKRKCDISGKELISVYAPDKPYKVYDFLIRWGDSWDPLDYGRDFDFQKPFFPQMNDLILAVPHSSRITGKSNENSDYTNHGARIKDCYRIFTSEDSTNCYYGVYFVRSDNSMDCYNCFESQNCYQSLYIKQCYNVFFSLSCESCNNSYYLTDCHGCSYCFGCTNIQNKKYYLFNQQGTKTEFDMWKSKMTSKEGQEEIKAKLEEIALSVPMKCARITNSTACTGDFITHSKGCTDSFDIDECEDCKHCFQFFGSKDCQDAVIWGAHSDLIYEGECVGNHSHKLLFCSRGVTKSSDMIYCYSCQSCTHCFACVGLKNKEYCILNKQYTQEQYNTIVPKIIEQMIQAGERGEFFPSSLSPMGYNETLAMESFPLSKEEALKQGFKRSDYEAPSPRVEKKLKADELPSIQEVTDEILQQAIICEVSSKPFRVINPELQFYRKHGLPLPTKHPNVRHAERMLLRNPRKLRERRCMKCGVDMKTSYAPERKEIVYCENCYNKEIYG